MQQQQPQMSPVMQSFPSANITTEQIQKYLDENKKLILAILDNQNLGKLAECAQYQALLQKNLMYLAAIADAQPQAVAIPPQMPSHPPAMQVQQGGGFFMPHPQAQAQVQTPPQAPQQAGIYPQKMPLQFGSSPHQLQLQDLRQQHLHQQAMSAQMQMGMLRQNNGLFHHALQHPDMGNSTSGIKHDAQGSGTGLATATDGHGEGSKEAK
ncbi:hypothetical protein SAY86_002519 [Trapa natans]|uniref:SS18 N-terminal domain-containing protein n=1 Tax=Trapa natans TaxID=22666 RepID=A0AAN7LR49_TRANT|nr:hypothetical protein SAY86_002519 [Trapa natans]